MKEGVFSVRQCYKDLVNNRLASGHDSDVYLSRDGQTVVKAYVRGPVVDGKISQEQLSFYKHVHYLGHELTHDEEIILKLPFSKTEFRVYVSRFLELDRCPCCGSVEGVAPFIQGRNLETPPFEIDLKDLKIGLTFTSKKIEERLGVVGVEITPVNVKRISASAIVVTDLCANIGSLKRKII